MLTLKLQKVENNIFNNKDIIKNNSSKSEEDFLNVFSEILNSHEVDISKIDGDLLDRINISDNPELIENFLLSLNNSNIDKNNPNFSFQNYSSNQIEGEMNENTKNILEFITDKLNMLDSRMKLQKETLQSKFEFAKEIIPPSINLTENNTINELDNINPSIKDNNKDINQINNNNLLFSINVNEIENTTNKKNYHNNLEQIANIETSSDNINIAFKINKTQDEVNSNENELSQNDLKDILKSKETDRNLNDENSTEENSPNTNFSQSNNNRHNQELDLNSKFGNIINSSNKIELDNGAVVKPISPNNSTTYNIKFSDLQQNIPHIISKTIEESNNYARINLSPKSLGTLVVEINQAKQFIDIKIKADSREIVNIIEQSINGLKEKLFQQGLICQNIDVNINLQNHLSNQMNKQEHREGNKTFKNQKKSKYDKSDDLRLITDTPISDYLKFDNGRIIEKYI